MTAEHSHPKAGDGIRLGYPSPEAQGVHLALTEPEMARIIYGGIFLAPTQEDVSTLTKTAAKKPISWQELPARQLIECFAKRRHVDEVDKLVGLVKAISYELAASAVEALRPTRESRALREKKLSLQKDLFSAERVMDLGIDASIGDHMRLATFTDRH